jgi:hypothetical protein
MPNWVSNSVRVTGDRKELQRFAEQAGKPYRQKRMEFGDEGMEWVWADDEVVSHLSFWNFVRPDDSIIDEYWGEQPQLPIEEALQNKTNHWYDWNIRNWGVKWDANDVYFEDWGGNELAYDFETPWGVPTGAYDAMASQYPTLNFSIRFVEEQGWGGEIEGYSGTTYIVKEWDIPETHEERMEYIGYCHCEEANEEDLDYLYDDCPRKLESANA